MEGTNNLVDKVREEESTNHFEIRAYEKNGPSFWSAVFTVGIMKICDVVYDTYLKLFEGKKYN